MIILSAQRKQSGLRRLWYGIFRDHPYSYPGRILVPLLSPGYLRRIHEDFLINPEHQSFLRKIIKAGIRWHYFAQEDAAIAGANRKEFWGSATGRKWHQMKAQALLDPRTFRQEFEEFRAPIVAHLRTLLQVNPAYVTLCEIGTGNGLFLRYLSRLEGFESLHRFVGIDLNAEQIEENRKTLATERVVFECVEVTEWIETRCQEGTIFLTHDTLHHFTPPELRRVLEAIRRFSAAAIVLSEPIDPRLPADVLSKPRGGIGISFSHNYAEYLRQCGYMILAHDAAKEGLHTPVPTFVRVCACAGSGLV